MEDFFISPKRENASKFNRNIAILGLVGLIGLIGIVGVFEYPKSSKVSSGLLQLDTEEREFQAFINKFHKTYTPEEYQIRFQNFKDNLAFIRDQNSQNLDWVLGVNQFSDLTFEEFRKFYLSPIQPTYNSVYKASENLKIPSSWDWAREGAVAGPFYQGKCQAAYAFAAVGAVESAWKIFNGTLIQLSEQEVVDCSKNFGNNGCSGGSIDGTFRYIIKNGITSDKIYPYKAKEEKCKVSLESESVAEISTFTDVNPNDTISLENAVAAGPVATYVDANTAIWMHYQGGVVTSNYCGTDLDHSVLITGYNLTMKPNYWIALNSWGLSWGEFGYIRIAIKSGPGICGIQMMPSYPTAAKRS